MRIGVDLDGVVRDLHKKLVQVYRREMGGDHWCDDPEKWYQYNISLFFSIDDGIYNFFFNTHAEEIYTKALPFPDIGKIKELHESGHDIIILTDQPNAKTGEYTLQWVNNHIPYNEIHFTNKKHLVPCGIYLDDAPCYIKDFKSHLLDFVIMNRRWNQNIDGYRVNNLTEFKEYVLRGMK